MEREFSVDQDVRFANQFPRCCPSQIVVENLSYFCTENDLARHFNSYLSVVDEVKLSLRYKDDGDSYPLKALVTLRSQDYEDFILRQFHGTLFMGRYLK